MSFLDKLLSSVKLNDDVEDGDDFFDDEEDIDEEETEKPRKRFFKKMDSQEEEEESMSSRAAGFFKGFGRSSEPKEPETAAPRQPERPVKSTKAAAAPAKEASVRKPSSKITPLRGNRQNVSNMEVCVIKPNHMNDAQEISDTLRDNCTVILNLEGMDVEVAQRIIDFSSGTCYALDGALQKVSSYIFIMTPANVDISGDFQQVLSNSFGMASVRTDF